MMEETVTKKVPECLGECEFGQISNGMIQKLAAMGSIDEVIKNITGQNNQDGEKESKEQSPKGGVAKAMRRISVLI